MSNTSMQVPEGYQIVTRVGYRIPDTFHSLQAARVTGRKWWQFWLPETVNIYMTVEKIPSANALLDAPVRLCCGQRHFGPVCPDGMVMCCLCFERVSQDKLNVASNGQKEDVCNECAERESASNTEVSHGAKNL